MNTYKKIFLTVVTTGAVLASLYISVLFFLPKIIDLNKYKDDFATQIEKLTGLKISCENIGFEKSIAPYLKINMYHTVILYPNNEIFLKLKDVQLKVKILPLICKKIVIKDVNLTRPIINVVLYKDFSNSIEKYIKTINPINTNGFYFGGIISDSNLNNYKINITDETIGKKFYLEGNKLILKGLKPNEKMDLTLKGSLYENNKEYISYDINLKSYIYNPALYAASSSESSYNSPFKQISDYNVHGNITGQLDINKNNNIHGQLQFNNFSLNIDNNILKDNSAIMEFKGEEVNISSQLHTTEKDIVKINGKVNYGKKKYIDLTVHAININLNKLSKSIKIFSRSINLPDLLKDISIKGLLDADFSLYSDYKKIKSKGSAKLINAEITHDSLPYKINKINSSINFNNNNIIIEKAQAYINSTPVDIEGQIKEDVSVDIKAYSENLDLRTVLSLFMKNINLPINISEGKLSFVSEIKGHPNKDINADTKITITSLQASDKKYKIPFSIKNTVLNIKNKKNEYFGNINCNDFHTIFYKKNISAKEINLTFDKNNIKIPENKINIITSPITITGIINSYVKNPKGQIIVSGDINSKYIADFLSEYIKAPYKASGSINTHGIINFTNDNIKVNTKLKSDKDNYLSYLVIKELMNKPSILTIDAETEGKNISLKEAVLTESGIQEPELKISGKIINKKESEFQNFRIQIPKTATMSMDFFGGEEISLNGDIILNGSIKSPNIEGSAKIYKYNLKRLYTSIKNADVNFAKDNIRIIAPETEINNSKLNITADIEPKFSKVITISNMQLNSLNLDMNTLFPIIQKQSNPFTNAAIEIKKGSATINNFKITDLKARDISADFSLKNNILKTEHINANAYNGFISGGINYDFNHSKMNINLIGKGLDIKNSLYDLCKLDDNLGGKADFTSSVSLLVGDYNTVIKSLSGRVSFDAQNGRMGTLGKFEYYLNAQNILYHGLANTTLNRIVDALKGDNTSLYRQANGILFLQNGYLISDEIKTIGQNMSLYIKGRHNMLSNQANLDIYGRISDEVKTKLGSFADVTISEIVNGQESKKSVITTQIPDTIISNIPELYNQASKKTNIFKVNVYGNINAVNAINSFSWIIPKENEEKNLPGFSQILQEL